MHPLNIKNRMWAHNILKKNPRIDKEQNMIEEDVFLH